MLFIIEFWKKSTKIKQNNNRYITMISEASRDTDNSALPSKSKC